MHCNITLQYGARIRSIGGHYVLKHSHGCTLCLWKLYMQCDVMWTSMLQSHQLDRDNKHKREKLNLAPINWHNTPGPRNHQPWCSEKFSRWVKWICFCSKYAPYGTQTDMMVNVSVRSVGRKRGEIEIILFSLSSLDYKIGDHVLLKWIYCYFYTSCLFKYSV